MFNERLGRDILGACRRLQDAGYLEILTVRGHARLPAPPVAQLAASTGRLRSASRRMSGSSGAPPRAIWLPECAYRPAYFAQSPSVRILCQAGHGDVPGRGGYRAVLLRDARRDRRRAGRQGGRRAPSAMRPSRTACCWPSPTTPRRPKRTTYQPYLVGASDVAVLARNERTGEQVWAGQVGYPGDPWYREFHRKDPTQRHAVLARHRPRRGPGRQGALRARARPGARAGARAPLHRPGRRPAARVPAEHGAPGHRRLGLRHRAVRPLVA